MVEEPQIICPNPECHRPIPRRASFCPYCGHDTILNNQTPSDDRRYFITRIVKQGGQGAVYEGIDQDGRVYAIKEMLDNFADEKERQDALARFNAEADLLQRMSHPRIPRIYSHFTDEGRHYLTMDFVRGEDLEQIIEREGALPEAQVLEWADQICDVLDHLHSKGLIYRDMKPSNIMIDEADGKIKLVDFGIAKVFKPTEKRGTQIGTPGYAPPEQYQGLATTASDIYALGATLHHALTGRDPTEQPPFSFTPARNLNVAISRRTSDALDHALKMRPEERFGSVAEFRAMLRPLPGTRGTLPQVRVVSNRTVALPEAAAQVAAVPSVRANPLTPPAPVPLPVAPPPVAPPAPRSQPAAAAPAPRKRQAAPRKRRGWIGGCVMTLLLALVGSVIAVVLLAPERVEPYLSKLPFDLPFVQVREPTIELGPQRALTLELTVTVSANPDPATLRAAFATAYAEQLAQDHPGAVINQNVGITYIGDPPQVIAQTNGESQYQAQVQAYVQLPQGP